MKDCTTCKYGYEDERLGIPMCHHPKRFSEDCVDFNMHEEKESEHLADAGKTLEIKPGDEVTINGHKFVYDKDKGYVTIVKSEESVQNDLDFEQELYNHFGQVKDFTLGMRIGQYFYDLGCRRTAEKYDEIEYNRQRAEESVPKDLEEAAWEYAPDLPSYNIGGGYLPPQSREDLRTAFKDGAKWQAEQDQETIELAEDHAYLAGAVNEREKMMKEGLDAVKSGQSNKIEKTIAGVFVKYGMDLQKEQMMKEAIHYVVQDDLDSHGASYNIPFIRIGTTALKPKGIGVGDKVRILIEKEDEK